MAIQVDPITRRLTQIAFVLGLVTVGFGQVAKRRVKKRYEHIDAYEEAVDYFTNNKHIKNFLGEPIRIRGVDVHDGFTMEDKNWFKFAVKATGPKSSARMYMEASRVPDVFRDHAHLTSLEVELENPRGRLKIV
ncbi:uncharacterized protein LOC129587657 [Paramacrobiotus metropolitanus]|uniref:uncharacterized protein LOC129587657 n=1 Tax=Paramacrobiotus metropolitanus TaxID=2943436 RepID=UPI0024462B70|nr:uncharacterized protein LOC129587657 [Paramacrobiotus metropolitanus]